MTTILAIQRPGHAEMWTDSGVVTDTRPFSSEQMPKATARNGMLVAAAGSAWLCDHLMYAWQWPTMNVGHWSLMTEVFAPALREELSDLNLDYTKSTDDWSLQLIVAVRGRVFQVEFDGTVLHSPTGVYAIGSGAAYALGAYAAYASPELAINAACEYDQNSLMPAVRYVSYPRPGDDL